MTTTAPPPSTTRVCPPRAAPDTRARPVRPVVTELRLAAFASHWRRTLPLGPLTLLTGPSGSGASSALRAYEALARLGAGDALEDVFPDPVSCVPERAAADTEGRRGFRIGCTVDGPAGPVRLDVAVQAEPSLRIVGERLTADGQTLLSTALRDPRRPTVQAAWHTAGQVPVTRAPLPDGRLATALLPLRVAGITEGQLRVLAAAEQVVVGLHSAFPCDPLPRGMRAPARAGEGRLRPGCDNLAAVLARTRTQCAQRHARLVATAAAGCAGPVTGLTTRDLADGTVEALVGRGAGRTTPVGRLGDGELRYLALALVLLTGPHVLEVNTPDEIPWAMRALTVLTDGFDRGLDGRQSGELIRLAAGICADGHLRMIGTVGESGAALAGRTEGATVVDLSG